MYHKVIGGKKKKKQKDILKSLDYLLRTQKPEEQKYVKILSGSKYDIINFNKYSMNSKKKTHIFVLFFHLKKKTYQKI